MGLPEEGLSRLVFDSDVSQRAFIGQAPDVEIWRHVAATLQLDERQLEELRRDFWAGDRLDAELVQFIRSLRPRYKTALLSNAWPDAREAFSRQFGLGGVVDAMIISAEEGVLKPDARIYQIAAARLDVRPEEAVFVDDMAANVAGAQAVGMRGVHFKSTPQTIDDVKRWLGA